MPNIDPWNSKAIVEKGRAIYESRLRSRFDTLENEGKLLSIDIVSGDCELGDADEDLEIIDRLRARQPDAVIYSLKIGYPAAVALGTRLMSYREMAAERNT